MSTNVLKNEAGYSLVEVMVAIMILSIAIIPMVGMFDAGLRAAVLGGNYDKARALANQKLEEVKVLPYKNSTATVDSLLEKYKPTNEPSAPAGLGAGTAVSCSSGIFTCMVTTRYVKSDLSSSPDPIARTSWIEIKVLVTWEGKSYETTGLKVTR